MTTNLKSHLLPGALALLASVIFPCSANAALIYSGVQNVAVPQTFGGTYLRITDGFTTGTDPGALFSTQPWLNPFFGGVDIANSDLLRPIITGTDQIVNLSAGTVINAGSNFGSAPSGSTTHVGAGANQFQLGTAGYIGFAFQTTTGGPDFYGWAQVVINNSTPGSIVDWAYDNTAGQSIQAGQIAPVPEPATLAAGLLCLGAGVLRRRRP